MRVALIGSVSSSWHTLRALIDGGADVACVLGLDESRAAQTSDYRSLRELAESNNIPFRAFIRIAEEEAVAFLQAHAFDLLFVIGLSQLAPQEMIDMAPAGAVGFHPTPLPEGRGRAPVAWTILLERQAAANLFYLTAEADAGPIIAQRFVEVRSNDYAQDLIDRTNYVLEEMVRDLTPHIRRGSIPSHPQDESRAKWYGRRGPEDGWIDWSRSASDIQRLIRAVSHPYPGALTTYRDQRIVIWRADVHEHEDHHGTLGQVLRADDEYGLLVQCGDGLLQLTEATDEHGAPLGVEHFRVGQRLGCLPQERIAQLEARIRELEQQAAQWRRESEA